MRKLFYSAAVVIALILFIGLTGANAQTGTTAINGDVTDPQGRPVVGAKVTINNTAASVTRETITDAAGHYQFLALPPGTYNVRAEVSGFRAGVVENVEALVSVTQTVNLRLEIGVMTETVTVNGDSVAQVNTTDATIGNAFDSHQILSLPFEGRDAAGVLSLEPGVAFVGTNVDDRFDTRNGAINGGRSDQANITLDGVDNNDQLRGTAFSGALRSTLDSIEEFRVTTAGANADEGRSSGGQVTLVTKSGTNDFHGAVFEQHRPTNMAANDWFNKHNELQADKPNIRPKLLRNTFGGALGGPIKKDRLFFFYTYEGQRISESTTISRNVPSATLRDGVIFYPCAPILNPDGTVNTPASQVCPAGGRVKGLSGTSYPVPIAQFGVGPAEIALMDPNCTAIGSCPQGAGVNPSVIAQLNKYPTATAGASNCTFFDGFGNVDCNAFSAPTPTRNNTNIAKLDYNINRSGTHRLFLRGNYQVDSAVPATGAQQFLGAPPNTMSRVTSRALAAGYTAVLSNNLLNVFRYGFTRQSQADVGLASGPLVSFRIFDDIKPNTATRAFHLPVHNWVDDLSWTRGKHTIQIGTNIRLINNVRQSNFTSFNTASLNPGFLTLEPAGHGISLDPSAQADKCNPATCPWVFPAVDPKKANAYNNAISSLVGLITQGNASYNFTKTGALLPQGMPVDRHFRAWEGDWYIQDVWHVKPNLTITAGLRYTILEPPYETSGTQAAPNISLHDFVDTRARMMEQGQVFNPTFSFDLSGQANGKKPYWNYDYKDLGPRIAIAYSPNASGGLWRALFGAAGKSSIRAGYGIIYDHFGEGIVNSFDQTGTFGLTTAIGNPTNQSVDRGARFTSVTNIPASSPSGVLLPAAPPGGFPATPPTSLQLFGGLGLDDKLKTPYSEVVDLAFTRELPGGFVFEAAYVGRFAHRLLQQRDLAMPLDLRDPKSGVDYFAAAKQFAQLFNKGTDVNTIGKIPYWENFFPNAAGVDVPGIGGYCGAGTPPANPTATQAMYEAFSCQIGPGTFGETNALFNIDAFCFPACATINGVSTPNAFYPPQFSTLYAWSSFGKSGYNSGEFTLRSKPTHGVQFDFNYTYSKSLDTGSDAERVPTFGGISAGVINTWNPNQVFGPSDFDIRHAINANWLVDLPFGKGKRFGSGWNRFMDTVAGGWQLTGLTRWSSGLPFTVSNAFPGGTGPFPTNFNLPGYATLLGAKPSTGLAVDSAGDPNVFTQGGAVAGSAFRFDFAGESGQRNVLRGQGFFGTDAGVNKAFRITERQSLRFSAYAFNIFNSVRFDAQSILNSFPVASTFGKYQGTLTTSRRLEFALRYQF